MHRWPTLGLRFSLAQYFAGNGSYLTGSRDEELEHVRDRITLRPLQIDLGYRAGLVSDLQEHCCDGVRDGAAHHLQHPVSVYRHAANEQVLFEIGGVGGIDLEKDDRRSRRDVAVASFVTELVAVLGLVVGFGLMSDDLD